MHALVQAFYMYIISDPHNNPTSRYYSFHLTDKATRIKLSKVTQLVSKGI